MDAGVEFVACDMQHANKLTIHILAAVAEHETNGNVEQSVTGVDGETLTVKYKDGEKKIIVPPSVPIVTFVPGDKADLKPGIKIFIVAAKKLPDGTLQAARVNYGKDGLTPPM
jgi:hypothetical protein